MSKNAKELSLEQEQNEVWDAFDDQLRGSGKRPVEIVTNGYLVATFEDYIIANYDEGYYKIPYSRKDDEVVFAPKDKWKEMERIPESWRVKTQKAIEKMTRLYRQESNQADTETLIAWGGAVKALGGGKIGGYLVRFSTEDDPDLEIEFFNKDTDFGEADSAPVYYQHGMDAKIGKRKLGKATHKIDEFGVWAEAQLNLRDEYENFIYAMAEKGKMGWSSGTASHLVERQITAKATWIKSWPLGLDDTLTPVPAEPRNGAVPLKSWHPEELGNTLAERMKMLNADLKNLSSDLGELVASIDKPLTVKKRKELSELLELCSGLDAVRSNIEQVLAAKPQSKLVASRLIGYQMAEAHKRLKAKNLLEE